MRKPIIIGDKEYKFKKDALVHYKAILNSYDFGEVLNEVDFNDIIDLLDYGYSNFLDETEELENNINNDTQENNRNEIIDDEIFINEIKVSKVQFNTKCFEIFYSDNSSEYISYIMIINNKQFSQKELFNIACRNAIYEDLRSVKKEFFYYNAKNGQVKCQETNQMSKWTELAVDHRQPNTFSIIVDRFKEVKKIEIDNIEYKTDEGNQIKFKDENLAIEFIEYHREKASLRIVRKESNLSRTGMARIKRTRKDLVIK